MFKNFLKKYDSGFLSKAQKLVKYNKKIEKKEDLIKNEFSLIELKIAKELGYSLSEDSRILFNSNNEVCKLEGISLADKEAVELFDKEFGANVALINRITSKDYFFIFKKYIKKTIKEEAHVISYNKKDLIIEKYYTNEKEEMHSEDSWALSYTDMSTESVFKYGYFINGKLHREGGLPAVIEYQKGTENIILIERCLNGEFHSQEESLPSYESRKRGFKEIMYHNNGVLNSPKSTIPAHICVKEKKFFDILETDGFWVKDWQEDQEAKELHIFYKDGKIHRDGDLPAIYSLDDNKKIVRAYYLKDHKLHRDKLKPAYVNYKKNNGSFFENDKDISEKVISWAQVNNVDLSNPTKKDILKWKEQK